LTLSAIQVYYCSMVYRTRSLHTLIFFALIGALAMMSCAGSPEPAPLNDGPDAEPVQFTEPALEPSTEPAGFDPELVSVELKETTFADISVLIETLNTIIRRRDFGGWTGYLTEEYARHYSDPAVLAEMSQEPALKRYNVVLRSMQDFFNYVVYPSRQNMRVDDIEFIDENKVRAITINSKEERLVLYNLEKIGDTWKIAIWR
jgi:hypothetical protein